MKSRYQLTIETTTDDKPAALRRLRAALKYLLRVFGSGV